MREIPAHGSTTICVRVLRRSGEGRAGFDDFDAVFTGRIAEADAFYAALQAGIADADMRRIQRQAFAGMLWSKQFYNFDVRRWLDGDPAQPPPPERAASTGRNGDWRHFMAADIMSMPDKWEYPWFAAWDLAFHCVTLSLIDPEFAKNQLLLLCRGLADASEWRSCRPMNGHSATSIRRCMPGQRCASSRTIAIRMAAIGDSPFWNGCSTSCC